MKSYDKPRQCVKNQSHHLADKGLYSQSCGYSSSHVWLWKKAECQRINAFKLWCWRRLFESLRVPWTARRSNQSILKEISPEYSLEWPMLKVKLQYFGYLVWRTDSLEKTLMLGKIEDNRRRGRQRMRCLDGITNSPRLLKLMSIESVMPSNHLFLYCPLLLLASIFPSIRVFSNESVLHIRWPKDWRFSFSISPSNEYSWLIAFRKDWLDLLAVQGILKRLLQHHSLNTRV